MKTYREFWIEKRFNKNCGFSKAFWLDDSGIFKDDHASLIHVIEHSAYAALEKDNEELKLAFQSLQSGFELDKLEKEITSLRESLKNQKCNCPHCDKHRGLD